MGVGGEVRLSQGPTRPGPRTSSLGPCLTSQALLHGCLLKQSSAEHPPCAGVIPLKQATLPNLTAENGVEKPWPSLNHKRISYDSCDAMHPHVPICKWGLHLQDCSEVTQVTTTVPKRSTASVRGLPPSESSKWSSMAATPGYIPTGHCWELPERIESFLQLHLDTWPCSDSALREDEGSSLTRTGP